MLLYRTFIRWTTGNISLENSYPGSSTQKVTSKFPMHCLGTTLVVTQKCHNVKFPMYCRGSTLEVTARFPMHSLGSTERVSQK